MRAALRIAAKDLRLRIRDRSAVIIGVAAPLALAFIFNLVFGGSVQGGVDLDYGIVDLDGSEVTRSFADVLEEIEAEGVLTVTPYPTRQSASEAVEAGEIDAFFFLDEGFGAAVASGGQTRMEVVGDVDAPISTEIAASIAEQFSIGIETARLAISTLAEIQGTFVTPEFLASLTEDPASAAFSFQIVEGSAANRQLDAATYFAAGMAVFFLFFTVQFGVAGLLEESREGTLARLFAAPIPRWSVVVGKGLVSFLLGVVSMSVLVVGTTVIMDARWGSPLGVAVLVMAGVAAATAIMGLVAAFARTPEGAGNLGSIIAVILGMLGGTFFPLGRGEDLLSKLSLTSPHAWFLRGLGDLANGAPWHAALPSAAAILVFAFACGTPAALLLRRRVAP
ncbi:MAG: ABC transporter permease [Acidimicrobiia bacterium]